LKPHSSLSGIQDTRRVIFFCNIPQKVVAEEAEIDFVEQAQESNFPSAKQWAAEGKH
jgi:hypothetical protein